MEYGKFDPSVNVEHMEYKTRGLTHRRAFLGYNI